MLIFGIDTCCMAATAALLRDNTLVSETVTNCGKTHSEKMMPQIENMFKSCGIDPDEVDAFAAAVGPGSFTGVRIGVATVKAMAQVQNKPCVAVSTLEALAYSSKYFDGIVSPILDARRNQVYNALFECGKSEMKRLTPDRALALDELLEELKALDKDIIFMGDGVYAFKDEIIKALGSKAFFAPETVIMNLGGAVAALGREKLEKGDVVSYADLVPSYIRLSQAERERLEKKEKL